MKRPATAELAAEVRFRLLQRGRVRLLPGPNVAMLVADVTPRGTLSEEAKQALVEAFQQVLEDCDGAEILVCGPRGVTARNTFGFGVVPSVGWTPPA